MIATKFVELNLHTTDTDKVEYYDHEADEVLYTDPFQFKINEVYSHLMDRFPRQFIFGNGSMSMFLQSQQQCIGVHALISVFDRTNIGRFEIHGASHGSLFLNKSRMESLLDILGGNRDGATHIIHNVLLSSSEYLSYNPEKSTLPVKGFESMSIRELEFAKAIVDSLVS